MQKSFSELDSFDPIRSLFAIFLFQKKKKRSLGAAQRVAAALAGGSSVTLLFAWNPQVVPVSWKLNPGTARHPNPIRRDSHARSSRKQTPAFVLLDAPRQVRKKKKSVEGGESEDREGGGGRGEEAGASPIFGFSYFAASAGAEH